MGQRFKTVYFPDPEGSSEGKALTLAFGARDAELYERVKGLSSLEIRDALQVSDWPSLVDRAANSGLSHSTFCLSELRKQNRQDDVADQLDIWGEPSSRELDPLLATYRGGNGDLFHDWFPYLEGYAPEFVERLIERFCPTATSVLDPFGGCGTTPLVAAMSGLDGWYCEVNPVLQFVTAAKIDALALDANGRAATAWRLREIARDIHQLLAEAEPSNDLAGTFEAVFEDSPVFESSAFDAVLRARSCIDAIALDSPQTARFVTVAALSSLLPASNQIRRGDVRYRRGREKDAVVPFDLAMAANLETIAGNISQAIRAPKRPQLVAEDARSLLALPSLHADAVITSPPYLNGTNYFRNTKLELWFLRSLRTPADLAAFRRQAVTAGINDVSRGKGVGALHPAVASVVDELERSAYDRRIPRMVQAYFEDMVQILAGLAQHVRPGGSIIIDIGDSNYAGVNVPTDTILAQLMSEAGADLKERVVLRKRQAKSGPPLRQVLLVFERRATPTSRVSSVALELPKWQAFKRDLPHQGQGYSKRNWGNPLHSLCSYAGKMKPSLASHLVDAFVPSGGTVLDPFAGVGTIPFEAALSGRHTYSFEISPTAWHVARAKLHRPDQSIIRSIVAELEAYLSEHSPTAEDYASAEAIRFNGRLSDYFHEATFREVLLARAYFAEHRDLLPEGSFVMAALLHVLHGNRPYALSRTSHPITPFAPSGPFEYKALIDKVRNKLERALETPLPNEFVNGQVFDQDATTWWPREVQELDAIITSPPFFDSTRFHTQNWMRLWFCGWEAADFRTLPQAFVDERQRTGFSVYEPIFRQARERLIPGGVLVMHLGKSRKSDMAVELTQVARPWFRALDLFEESVEHTESHGIRDKGTVTSHSYLVLG